MADIDELVVIRFDGKDADRHELDLLALGVSMQGIAKIASSTGTFAITHRHSRQLRKQVVRVAAREPRANCFSMDVVWNFVQQHQILSGSFGAVVAALMPVIYMSATKRKDETSAANSALVQLLREQVTRDRVVIDQLMNTVDRLTNDLRPAVRQTLEPLGVSCRTMTIKVSESTMTFDEADKAASHLSPNDEITDVQDFSVLFTELDVERSTGKAYVADFHPLSRRIPTVIMDSSIQTQHNLYVSALSSSRTIEVKGRALLRNNRLVRLFVIGPAEE